MNQSSGETQREAAALAESLVNQNENATPQNENTVPVHVVQAIREELKAEKEKNSAFQNHFNMTQWRQNQQAAPAPVDPFKDIDPEESIKAKDAMRLYSDLNQRFESKLAEIKISQSSPDYGDMIKKYLPLAAQEDPEIMQEIQRSPNPYKTAYLAAKASKAYQEDSFVKRMGSMEKPKAHPNAERIVQNAKQSGSLTSVASNSTSSGQHASFSGMSDDEFIAFKNSRQLRPAKSN